MTILQKLFSFQGRLRRRDYWLLGLLIGVVTVAVVVLLLLAFGVKPEDERLSLAGLLVIWPSLAMMVKRIHDRNKSGWLALVYWVPSIASNIVDMAPADSFVAPRMGLKIVAGIIGLWFLIEFGFMDGTQGPNRYGKSPKGVGGDTRDKLEEVFA
ncbi:DUF805 domain-containing protein [Caulobacter soli]|uniref:DUF805 domain-containing protein n=1 Tax=Caulobacter soli TaxID=2708539 RepID=UPI0013EAA960|nr:DUF805 domain-containing protein [Caulobacter soli]